MQSNVHSINRIINGDKVITKPQYIKHIKICCTDCESYKVRIVELTRANKSQKATILELKSELEETKIINENLKKELEVILNLNSEKYKQHEPI